MSELDESTSEKNILIVGKSRSGTKWLSNIFCNHPKVAGVRSERSEGIIETNISRNLDRKFDLRYPGDYAGSIELWPKSEFFITSGIDKDIFTRQLLVRQIF